MPLNVKASDALIPYGPGLKISRSSEQVIGLAGFAEVRTIARCIRWPEKYADMWRVEDVTSSAALILVVSPPQIRKHTGRHQHLIIQRAVVFMPPISV
ncbi:MAG: hypothetical protein Q9205_007594 [Flavoplaca limonia]